jgi:hypothetical protein
LGISFPYLTVAYQSSLPASKQTAELLSRHLYDVTIGNPAIFPKQDALKGAQQANMKTCGFPSSSHDGFGFALE